MRIAYIGDLRKGTTSRSRFNAICLANKGIEPIPVDISVPILKTNRIFRSYGWRYYRGPLIDNVNKFIADSLNGTFDLIWVDKGYFIYPSTLLKIKTITNKIVHYTPDVAFVKYQSKLFTDSIHLYDLCYTTKSFEIEFYKTKCKEVVFCAQGFDSEMLNNKFDIEKKKGVIFIGLFEKSRKRIIDVLLKNNIEVKLGGVGWYLYYLQNRKNKNLKYLGSKVFGTNYISEISNSMFGLGLMSKKFMELHTTRTFEIPACGTILITEKNVETLSFFNPDEVIFFEDIYDIPSLINDTKNHIELALKGRNRVVNDVRDYMGFFKIEFEKRYKVL